MGSQLPHLKGALFCSVPYRRPSLLSSCYLFNLLNASHVALVLSDVVTSSCCLWCMCMPIKPPASLPQFPIPRMSCKSRFGHSAKNQKKMWMHFYLCQGGYVIIVLWWSFGPIANQMGPYFQPSFSVCLCVSDRNFYPSTLTDFDETWSQGPYCDLVWPRP